MSVRRAIKREFAEAAVQRGGVGDPGFVLAEPADKARARDVKKRLQNFPRQAAMFLADFCPCPEGDSPSAKRQYDALLAGCVPVVASDDALWAFSREQGLDGALDPLAFALHVPEAALAGRNATSFPLLDALDAAAPRLARLRRAGAAAAWAYRYYAQGEYGGVDPLVSRRFPDGGALAVLVRALEARAKGARWPACEAEAREPHFRYTKQWCGAVPAEREVKRLRADLKRAPESRRASIEKHIAAYASGRIFR